MSDTLHADSASPQAATAAATPPPTAPEALTPSLALPGADAPDALAGEGIGQRIGRYEIRSLLGQGGMGQVFLAFDVELARPVALKVIHSHLVWDERVLARFRQEARSVARLNHPGIVQIYEFGQDPNPPGAWGARGKGVPFLAMEYVEGRSLTNLIEQRGPLGLDQALRLALSAIQALEYALTQHIVHRDIKPSNLLISRLGILKILDFGLARSLVSDAEITQSGAVVGSPHYMSPEQGRGERADHRSDIYSLGVTLFHTLSGTRPFEGDSPLAIMLKHVQEPLPRSGRIVPLLGGRVQALLERMTAKDPADRFQTYAELRTEMRKILAAAASNAGAMRTGATADVPLGAVSVQPVSPTPPPRSPASTPPPSGSDLAPPFALADLMDTQVRPQQVPAADSGASATRVRPAAGTQAVAGTAPPSALASVLAGFPASAPLGGPASATVGAQRTALPAPRRHMGRIVVLALVALVAAAGLLALVGKAYQAGLRSREGLAAGVQPASTGPTGAPAVAPGAPGANALPGGGRGRRGLQVLDGAALERFFSVDRLEANQALVLGTEQSAITEKIRKMDFAGALSDLDRLRDGLEAPGRPLEAGRVLGIAPFIYVVGEMEQLQEDIIAYVEAQPEPLEMDLPDSPGRTIRILGATQQDLLVTLVDGAAPFDRPWNEGEGDPQFVYRLGLKACGAAVSDEQRRRLTVFARYFGVAQGPGERLDPTPVPQRSGLRGAAAGRNPVASPRAPRPVLGNAPAAGNAPGVQQPTPASGAGR